MSTGKTIVTIGAGLAGVEASALLSEMGHNVVVIEKEAFIGGKMNRWDRLFPNGEQASEIRNYLDRRVLTTKLRVLTNTEIVEIKKQKRVFYLQTNSKFSFKADAVLLATGFEPFDASRKEEYGYQVYDRVITSADLEQLFRTDDWKRLNGVIPKQIGIVHCVGSRDEKCGNHHCSKVCCITAVKQAIELREKFCEANIFCFYMDLRMYGRGFEELYREAQEKHHIQFIRGRVSEVSENHDLSLQVKAEDTLTGRPLRMPMDLLVLMVGMEAGKGTQAICKTLDISNESDGFIPTRDPFLKHNNTPTDGIFTAGACTGPKSVIDTMNDARSAAFQINQYFKNN